MSTTSLTIPKLPQRRGELRISLRDTAWMMREPTLETILSYDDEEEDESEDAIPCLLDDHEEIQVDGINSKLSKNRFSTILPTSGDSMKDGLTIHKQSLMSDVSKEVDDDMSTTVVASSNAGNVNIHQTGIAATTNGVHFDDDNNLNHMSQQGPSSSSSFRIVPFMGIFVTLLLTMYYSSSFTPTVETPMNPPVHVTVAPIITELSESALPPPPPKMMLMEDCPNDNVPEYIPSDSTATLPLSLDSDPDDNTPSKEDDMAVVSSLSLPSMVVSDVSVEESTVFSTFQGI
jgi:hypothetical protein